jgi:hypothetical protein
MQYEYKTWWVGHGSDTLYKAAEKLATDVSSTLMVMSSEGFELVSVSHPGMERQHIRDFGEFISLSAIIIGRKITGP